MALSNKDQQILEHIIKNNAGKLAERFFTIQKL